MFLRNKFIVTRLFRRPVTAHRPARLLPHGLHVHIGGTAESELP